MARHKLKPNYNNRKNMEQVIQDIVEYYGEPYDDRLSYSYDHVSLRQVAKKFDVTVLKVRKILITSGYYSIEQSRRVNALHSNGMKVDEIMLETGLSRASVQSYLPYTKTIYNMVEKSVGAERMERWRKKVKG